MPNIEKIKKSCINRNNGSIISVSENSMRFEIINNRRQNYFIIRIDGCQICGEEQRCDYVIVEEVNTCYFIELKGSDVSHAVKQLSNTIKLLISNTFICNYDSIECYIVCSQSPSMTASAQSDILLFKRIHRNVKIKIKTRIASIIRN